MLTKIISLSKQNNLNHLSEGPDLKRLLFVKLCCWSYLLFGNVCEHIL